MYIWPDSTLLEIALAIIESVKEDVDRTFEKLTQDAFSNNAQCNYSANHNQHI